MGTVPPFACGPLTKGKILASWDAQSNAEFDGPQRGGAWHEVAGRPSRYRFTTTTSMDDQDSYYFVVSFDSSEMGVAGVAYAVSRVIAHVISASSEYLLRTIDASSEKVAYSDYPKFLEYGGRMFDFDKKQTPIPLPLRFSKGNGRLLPYTARVRV